ncbi:MAG: YfiR family protein, partial [Proteobacteria bacterium]|nr:YfiR family protein [Pseudomonadota bacterium]
MAVLIRRRLGAAAALGGLALVIAASAGRAAESDTLELAIKATYLYKLAPFVSWPQAVWAGPGAPLTICVQGLDPFGRLLDRAVSGQTVGGRPVTVRRLARIAADSGCQVAYLGGGPAQSQAQALAAVEGAPVLTVTDESHGGPRGIVNLVLDSGRVRFAIDATQADRNGIAISSKLLALALGVK